MQINFGSQKNFIMTETSSAFVSLNHVTVYSFQKYLLSMEYKNQLQIECRLII